MSDKKPTLSLVVPVFNESLALPSFNDSLLDVLGKLNLDYEVVYVDDGSADNSSGLIRDWHKLNARVRLVRLSRNFGKESALAAGIAQSRGEAIIMIDSDGQHPVEAIPEFVAKWQNGAQVVVGISKDKQAKGSLKRLGSKIFYKIFNKIAFQQLIPGSTDFRLINQDVKEAFLKLKENDRITRGLVDWLGFKRQYVTYQTKERAHGTATYSHRKLINLAANSFISLSTAPIHLFGYLGLFITLGSLLAGVSIIIEQLILDDPLKWNYTGTAMLAVLTIFLVGLVLLSQGIMSLYVSRIHSQSKQRPLFVIDPSGSIDIDKEM